MMDEIVVKTQEELDKVLKVFNRKIIIDFGTAENPAVVKGSSTVYARGSSTVYAYDNSTVTARGSSTVCAYCNSMVYAYGNVQVVDRQFQGVINVSGNARVVCDPRNIDEYIDFYALGSSKNTVKLFKAVHKRGGLYLSSFQPDFEYKIGEIATADRLDEDIDEECGHGIHMAYLDWCLDYGSDWDDLAILEVEALKDEVVVPRFCTGKVRAKSVKVIREVPHEEYGVFGKILERRIKSDNYSG